MSKLAELANKYKLDEHEILDLLDYVKKAGNEAMGIALWVKSLEDNVEDMRFQLKAKGHEVDVVRDLEDAESNSD